eukprot:1919591-Alexandrium_andersonii.AAC.1
MSASLVGSEMCIRDRWWPRQPSARRRFRGPRWPRPLAEIRHPLTFPGDCLLYTSDAADDM